MSDTPPSPPVGCLPSTVDGVDLLVDLSNPQWRKLIETWSLMAFETREDQPQVVPFSGVLL